MSRPRLKNGNPLRPLGRGFFVLHDDFGSECSDRAEGDVWVGVEGPGRLTFILMPDTTTNSGQVELKPWPGRWAATWGMYLDEGEPVQVERLTPSAWGAADTVTVVWDAGLEAMA